jgi:NAD-dependent deacetylase
MKKEILDLIDNSSSTAAFTGAGISTLSGIRDFRGKNGLYKDFDADRIFDLQTFLAEPDFFYSSTKDYLYSGVPIEPSLVHKELARLEKIGKLRGVVTQNIDRLHTAAGSRVVFELHGSAQIHTCLGCSKEYSYDEILRRLEADLHAPRCSCGGIIKPNITFFGEGLPEEAFLGAQALLSDVDLLLVLGSSLVVQPAASLPAVTLRKGGKLVIVNDGATVYDDVAVLRLDSLEDAFE